MSLALPRARDAVAPAGWSARTLAAPLMLLAAVATRFNQLGNPAIQMDEQFYLLVGDRMWSGALPYVDIWDRKPIGLFLIYAFARRLSPDGILGAQLMALVFAAATAWVISRLASRIAGGWPAVGAGAAYLIYLPIMGGAGGQAPVFYNLLVTSAALLIVKATEAGPGGTRGRMAAGAMLLAGLAIQVKTTVVFEGAAFGLWLLWVRWRETASLTRTALSGALWLGIALAPAAVAFGAYAAMGHGDAWIYANVVSEFLVREPAGTSSLPNLISDALLMTPLLAVALVGAGGVLARPPVSPTARFLVIWAAAAVAAFFPLGRFYNHYALPSLAPLAALTAPLLAGPIMGPAILALLLGWAVRCGGLPSTGARDLMRVRVAALSAAVQPYADKGCVYLHDGPSVVYLKTRACLPGPYVFPEHLGIAAEARATHATQAMAALVARSPAAVMVADAPLDHPPNLEAQAVLDRALAAHYRLKAVLPDVFDGRNQRLYVRDDLK